MFFGLENLQLKIEILEEVSPLNLFLFCTRILQHWNMVQRARK